MIVIEIVDHDEIEIGACRHLARAEPPQRDDGTLAAADAAIGLGEIDLRPCVNGAQEHIGEPSENLAGLLRGDRTGQDSRPNQKHVLLTEQTDRIQHGLVAAGFAERARQHRLQPVPVRCRAEEGRIDQRIDEMRIERHDIGEPRRDAQDQRDEADQFRVLPQQGKEAAAGAQG